MQRYQDFRLSTHFVMLDFMQDRDLYTKGVPLPPEDILTDSIIEHGSNLCNNLLEPMIALFGPCSLAAGFCPDATGHYAQTPHCWQPSRGAAVDAAFHDWVNLDKAPIKLLEQLVKHKVPFERLITYAGSEYICIAWKKNPRFALYENMRIPGQIKPAYMQHTKTMGNPNSLPDSIPNRPDWRRGPNEVVYHTRRSLRPQHVRLGRYFTLLDFCRSEIGLRLGLPWVLPIEASQQAWYGRMMAEVLDPVVAQVGRVSVTLGALTPQIINRLKKDEVTEQHRWTTGRARIKFLLPQGVDFHHVQDHFNRKHVVDVTSAEHPSDAVEITMVIEPFQPKTIYSGGYPFGYYAGMVPDHLPPEVQDRLKNK